MLSWAYIFASTLHMLNNIHHNSAICLIITVTQTQIINSAAHTMSGYSLLIINTWWRDNEHKPWELLTQQHQEQHWRRNSTLSVQSLSTHRLDSVTACAHITSRNTCSHINMQTPVGSHPYPYPNPWQSDLRVNAYRGPAKDCTPTDCGVWLLESFPF